MALLTVQQISRAGLTRSLTAAAGGGDTFANDGRTFLEVANRSGGSITVTIVTTANVDGNAVADTSVAVGAGVTMLIGPFPPATYNDANGIVSLTYSGVTSLTLNPFRLP